MVFLTRRCCWVLAALALALVPADARADTEEEIENRLKTEFIERFTQFIEWPGADADKTGPFVIGVYGRTSLARGLRDLARRQRIKDRPGRVLQLDDPQGITDCHVLFIAESAAADLPEVLALTDGQPILTIGDTPGFARRGVLINFARESDRLRFEVNTRAVERSGLRFSSRLLRLATLVGSEPEP